MKGIKMPPSRRQPTALPVIGEVKRKNLGEKNDISLYRVSAQDKIKAQVSFEYIVKRFGISKPLVKRALQMRTYVEDRLKADGLTKSELEKIANFFSLSVEEFIDVQELSEIRDSQFMRDFNELKLRFDLVINHRRRNK